MTHETKVWQADGYWQGRCSCGWGYQNVTDEKACREAAAKHAEVMAAPRKRRRR